MAHFITLEGGEGSGKTTQARLLVDYLKAQGIAARFTREPGGAPGAEILRDMLLHGAHEFSAEAEVMLHFAARAEHVARLIRPALAAGECVVCDRFFDSTMAYQGFGLGADRAAIAVLSGVIGLVPDVTFVLRVSPDIAAARMARRAGVSDRYEARDAAFHGRVADGFADIAAHNPDRCVVINADEAVADVHAAIVAALVARAA